MYLWATGRPDFTPFSTAPYGQTPSSDKVGQSSVYSPYKLQTPVH